MSLRLNANSTDDYDPIQTALTLNYATVSLYRIVSYNDVMILQQEYENIINNINLSKIEDEEIIQLFTGLMDTLTYTQINDKHKQFVQRKYERKVENALYDSFSTGLSGAMGNARDPFSAGAAAMSAIGSSYFSYRRNLEEYKEERDEKEWQLDSQIILDLNNIRKDFFESSWKLQKKYEFPDQWRLTENQVEEYVETLKDNDAERRYRKLKRMEGSFQAYPPFWYYFGATAQELNKNTEALQYYEKFKNTRKGIFRKDPFLVSANMKRIVLLNDKTDQETKIGMLNEIIDNSQSSDWNNILFAALQYIKMRDYNNAKMLLIRNLDNEQEVSLHNRIMGEIMLVSKSGDKIEDLINTMIDSDNVKNQDVLYLYGKTNYKLILKKLEPQILAIKPFLEKNMIGDDDVVLELPIKWFFEDLYASMEIKGQNYDKPEIKTDPDNRIALCTFKKILNSSDYIDQGKEFYTEINLQHKSCPLKIVYRVKPGEVKKEKHGVTKWAQKKLGNNDEEQGTFSKWTKKLNKTVEDVYEEDSLIFTMTKVIIDGKDYTVRESKIVYN